MTAVYDAVIGMSDRWPLTADRWPPNADRDQLFN